MPNPYLVFCPYLPMNERVEFADWELGPLQSFEDRWVDDSQFKAQATAFLRKLVGIDNEPINRPALLCRKDKQLDGQRPSGEEMRALELSITFAFIDRNPRNLPENHHDGSFMVTADNAELHVWPIDLEHGRVIKSTGLMVSVNIAGYKISDSKLVLSPPLDLHMPMTTCSPDLLVLTGIYKTVLSSLRSPGEDHIADRVRVAVDWFAKAWRNTATVHHPERLVFLKTAFEALTGTSKTHQSARKLRCIFEELSDATAADSEILAWSPEEKPVHIRNWVDKSGRSRTRPITDLDAWFMAFGDARNEIIHEGKLPPLTYSGANPNYNGHFVFTAEFLLRGAIKVLLSTRLGYDDAWRSELWRTIKANEEKTELSKSKSIIDQP